MLSKPVKITLAAAIVLFIFTLTFPLSPVLQLAGKVPLAALLLYALYRLYTNSDRQPFVLAALAFCLVLEAINLILSVAALAD